MDNKPTTKGRPRFKPTTQQRSAVSIAAGAGMTHETIALALGINRATLTRHFKLELSSGAAAKRIGVMQALHGAAVKGNVAAAKAYLLLGAAPVAPREVPLGKKAQANLDAIGATLGTEWEDILDPPQGPDEKTRLQ